MENPVRKQLNDFIGRRQVTHPQFIRTDNMDQYFRSIGVDGQRDIVRGLLRCSDLTKISEDTQKKILRLYNNLYQLKDPIKKRRTVIAYKAGEKTRKIPIIRILDENQRLTLEIVDQLIENSEETAQAIINWTISSVNLFEDAYLTNRCEIDCLKKTKDQAVHLAEQLAEIITDRVTKMESEKSDGSSGLFASKAKKTVLQDLENKISAARQVITDLKKTKTLIDEIREPIFQAYRVGKALQADSVDVKADWKTFFEAVQKDEKSLPIISATSGQGLKSPTERDYGKTFEKAIDATKSKIHEFRQGIPEKSESLREYGIEDIETAQRVTQTIKGLISIINNLFLELKFAYQSGHNRKQQILRDRQTYEEETRRTDEVLRSRFARTLEEIFPADFIDSKETLNTIVTKGITRDQYLLLRSEINFWSRMKEKIFEAGKENRQEMFIRRRRMVNEILPDEKYYIEYSDKLRKTIDIANSAKRGFEPFVQQDFHELLKYLVKLYKSAESSVRRNEKQTEKEKPENNQIP